MRMPSGIRRIDSSVPRFDPSPQDRAWVSAKTCNQNIILNEIRGRPQGIEESSFDRYSTGQTMIVCAGLPLADRTRFSPVAVISISVEAVSLWERL